MKINFKDKWLDIYDNYFYHNNYHIERERDIQEQDKQAVLEKIAQEILLKEIKEIKELAKTNTAVKDLYEQY